MNEPHVIFAPVLKSEGWISIDLQQENILDALRASNSPPSVSVLEIPERGACIPMIRRFLRDVYYPARIRAEVSAQREPTLLHVSDHSYGHLCRTHRPCVVNCNDLHHFVTPDLKGIALWRWKQRAATMRLADRVITVSENLAREVREHLQLPAERVVALHGGIDTRVFSAQPTSSDSALAPVVASLREKHPVILNIGSNIRRKNLPTVLRALAILRDSHQLDARLVKIGAPLHGGVYQTLMTELDLREEVIDLGYQTPEQVAAACRLAGALSFASLYEGFGRPTLEAQACGLPCVLADASCMREIGGDGALYHSPTDEQELAAQLHRVLTDSTLRSDLIQRGQRNVSRFSWSNYAAQLRQLYRDVAKEQAAAFSLPVMPHIAGT